MIGESLLYAAEVADFFEVGIHLLVGENRKQPSLGGNTFVLLNDELRDVEQQDVGGHVGFLSFGHYPFLAVKRHDVALSQMCHVDVRQACEAGENEDVANYVKAWHFKVLLHDVLNLFIGQEAAIHFLEPYLEVGERVAVYQSESSCTYRDGLEVAHHLHGGVVGATAFLQEVVNKVADDSEVHFLDSDVAAVETRLKEV